MSAEPATNVVPFPQPDKVQILAEKVQELADQNAALLTALSKAETLNKSLRTQLDNIKKEQAEDCDQRTVRELVRWHYRQVGREDAHKRRVPMTGLDATIVRWLLRETEFLPRDVALASVGFAADDWHRKKGLVSLQQMTQTKVDMPGKDWQRKILDPEKVWRWVQAGKKLRGAA